MRPDVRVHSASRFTGAWPSGKATGFGPVIPGSNPGAPANVPTMSESRPKLAAVVMAGGRGTRMRSAVPKHLHPILGPPDGRLGRRGSPAARARAARRRGVARHGRPVRGADGRSPGTTARNRGRGAERRAGARRRRRGPDSLRRHAAPDDRVARGADRDASDARRRGDRALVRPDDIRSYGRVVRDAGR